MDNEIKNKWIAALKSGEFNQCRNSLVEEKTDNTKSFCCLGVLCEVEKVAHLYDGEHYGYLYEDTDRDADDRINEMRCALNITFLHKVGLVPEHMENLIKLNDQKGYSFDKIADYLKTHKEI